MMSYRQRIEKLSNRMNKVKQNESGINKQHSQHDFGMIGKGLVRGHNGDE